jgi:hypothetical protein
VQLLAALIVLQRVVVPAAAHDAYQAAAIAVIVVVVSLASVVKFAPAGAAALIAGLLVAIFVLDGDARRAALLAPVGLLGLPLAAWAVDRLRRSWPRSYKPIALVIVAGLVGAALLVGSWLLEALAAVAVIVAVTLLAIAFVHLVFLGAFALIWHWGEHRAQDYLEDEEAENILEWRHGEERPQLSPRARRIGNIVYPGAANPHGPIQRFVAEIFDSDEPPFFKNFLEMKTKDGELLITVHTVTGEAAAASVSLGPWPITLAPATQEEEL